MDIRISIRQLGKKRRAVEAVPFVLPDEPQTLRSLIAMLARTCAEGYNARLRAGEVGIRPLTEQQLTDMETVGKMAFGVVYGDKPADPDKAVSDALLAFTDGLYRVFQGTTELTDLDTSLTISANDEFTLIRLTMLAGSIW